MRIQYWVTVNLGAITGVGQLEALENLNRDLDGTMEVERLDLPQAATYKVALSVSGTLEQATEALRKMSEDPTVQQIKFESVSE